jgi:cytochrome c
VSWVVDGVTCRGVTEFSPGGTLLTQGALQLTYATCAVRPPPPRPLTDPFQIAQQKNCIACHSVTSSAESVNGVSMQVIAQRYRGNPPAAGVLEAKVKGGSIGTFGTMPMPANPQISDAELAIVIPWILAQ